VPVACDPRGREDPVALEAAVSGLGPSAHERCRYFDRLRIDRQSAERPGAAVPCARPAESLSPGHFPRVGSSGPEIAFSGLGAVETTSRSGSRGAVEEKNEAGEPW
jgi:hypothetical protein